MRGTTLPQMSPKPSQAGSPTSARSGAMRKTRSKPMSATRGNFWAFSLLLAAHGHRSRGSTPDAARFPRLPRIAPRRWHGQPLACAHAVGASLAVPLSRTHRLLAKPQRARRRVAEASAAPAKASHGNQGKRHRRRGRARRRTQRSPLDRTAQSGRAASALRLWPSRSPKRSASTARTHRLGRATCFASRARAARNGSTPVLPVGANRDPGLS